MARGKKKTRKGKASKRRVWSIGDYSRYIKEAKKEGLTKAQAQRSYKTMRGRLGRSVFASDIKRHSGDFSLTKQELIGEAALAESLIEELMEDAPDNIQTLYDRHYGDPDYRFLAEEGIIKISISTTKTRKGFEVPID